MNEPKPEPMNCPFCGADIDTICGKYREFKCHSINASDTRPFRQSDKCKTITLTKERDKLAEVIALSKDHEGTLKVCMKLSEVSQERDELKLRLFDALKYGNLAQNERDAAKGERDELRAEVERLNHMLAAAPDLLVALKIVQRGIELGAARLHPSMPSLNAAMIDAAIAKAEAAK